MRHKQRKNRWPIAVSLLSHSLFIVLALGFTAFGTRTASPDAMTATIVSSLNGDSEASKVVQKTASRPRVIVEVDEAKPIQSEEEKPDDAHFLIEPAGQTDQTETTEETPAASSSSGDHGQAETMKLTGVGPDSTGSEFVTTASEDALDGFLLQVRQAIEHHKQYPRRARLEGLEGTTQLRFRILPTGETTDIQVEQSSQSAMLDEEAVATVRRVARFPQPPVKSPMGILIRLPFVFHLEKGG